MRTSNVYIVDSPRIGHGFVRVPGGSLGALFFKTDYEFSGSSEAVRGNSSPAPGPWLPPLGAPKPIRNQGFLGGTPHPQGRKLSHRDEQISHSTIVVEALGRPKDEFQGSETTMGVGPRSL